MQDFIIVAVIVVIIACAAGYIIKAKKNGAKCIGCSAGGNCCSSKSNKDGTCTCSCSSQENNKTK